MTNSLLEQLERDAKKAGAWQAKIAYIAYLIEKLTGDQNNQIKQLLDDIHLGANAPLEYQMLAWFYLGKYHEKTNGEQRSIIECYAKFVASTLANQQYHSIYPTEFSHACAALVSIYKNTDRVISNQYQLLADKFPAPKNKLTHTEKDTPEFSYKNLRYAFMQNIIDLDQYKRDLKKLLNHRELTDTLEAKIHYQLLRVALLKAKESGSQADIHDAMQKYCHALTIDPHFAGMNKAENANLIAADIEDRLREMNNDKYMDVNRPEYTTTSGNIFVRSFLSLRNGLYLLFNRNKRLNEKREFITNSIKNMAGKILESSRLRDPKTGEKSQDNAVMLFNNEKTSYGKISDDLSCGRKLVRTPIAAENVARTPYSRLLHAEDNGKNFQLFVKSLTGSTRTIFGHPNKTVAELKSDLCHLEEIPVDQQRLIFSGMQLSDEKRLNDYNIERECTLHLVLRLSGD